MTMQQYCADALQVQDACNPVAVINTLAEHLNKWRELGYKRWDDLRRDAPFILFADKLSDMAGGCSTTDYGQALKGCEMVVKGEHDAKPDKDHPSRL